MIEILFCEFLKGSTSCSYFSRSVFIAGFLFIWLVLLKEGYKKVGGKSGCGNKVRIIDARARLHCCCRTCCCCTCCCCHSKNILKWMCKFFAFAGFLSGCGATIAEDERQGNDLKRSFFFILETFFEIFKNILHILIN